MSDLEISAELLLAFEESIGDLNPCQEQENYYKGFLVAAKSDLMTDDISLTVLNSDLGIATTVLYAEALMNKADIATNPTISLLRNKLSLITKGERANV